MDLPLSVASALFGLSALFIVAFGIRLTRIADAIADRTALGEAMVGGVFLGAATSMSGTVTSVTAALGGEADLAYANAVGGIAAQTAFLAIADIVYRRANLEHAAADVSNLTQAAVLMVLLSIAIAAGMLPPATVLGIHPASVILVAAYAGGVVLARRDREDPMWRPRQTTETRADVPDEQSFRGPSLPRLGMQFVLIVALMGACGWLVAVTGSVIAAETGLGGTVVGALMTATVTSLPELVTTISAVRQGALQLAVGGIIGGNTFDVLFLSASDVAYRDGSLFHGAGATAQFWSATGVVMTGILLIGLIRRQRRGPGGIGFESVGILGTYVLAATASVLLR